MIFISHSNKESSAGWVIQPAPNVWILARSSTQCHNQNIATGYIPSRASVMFHRARICFPLLFELFELKKQVPDDCGFLEAEIELKNVITSFSVSR